MMMNITETADKPAGPTAPTHLGLALQRYLEERPERIAEWSLPANALPIEAAYAHLAALGLPDVFRDIAQSLGDDDTPAAKHLRAVLDRLDDLCCWPSPI